MFSYFSDPLSLFGWGHLMERDWRPESDAKATFTLSLSISVSFLWEGGESMRESGTSSWNWLLDPVLGP